MLSASGSRGQTLPIWAFGSLSALVLLALVLNYGHMLMWQIRAQNAADAAARALLAAQTSEWNSTTTVLHAAAIDEYRIRYIINDLSEVIGGNGGCNPHSDYHDPKSCDAMYLALRSQYLDAVARYTNDVTLLHRVSFPSQTDQINTMRAALARYQAAGNCGTSTGGDCAFQYTLVAATPRQDAYLEDVYADSSAFVIGGGTHGNPKADLSPLNLELVTCYHVPSMLPSFFTFSAPAYYAVGRSAATTIMSTQEFMYVGSIINPTTNNVFQPTEYPETTTGAPADRQSDDDNYRIDYGGNPNNAYNNGNPATSDGKFGFTYVPSDEGLLTATGWWTTMAIKPFSGPLVVNGSFACK